MKTEVAITREQSCHGTRSLHLSIENRCKRNGDIQMSNFSPNLCHFSRQSYAMRADSRRRTYDSRFESRCNHKNACAIITRDTFSAIVAREGTNDNSSCNRMQLWLLHPALCERSIDNYIGTLRVSCVLETTGYVDIYSSAFKMEFEREMKFF